MKPWIAYALVAALTTTCFVAVYQYTVTPEPTVVTKTVYREHPEGLVHLPAFDSRTEHPVYPLALVCEAWGTKGLNPKMSVPSAGQRLVSDCSFVRVGPKG